MINFSKHNGVVTTAIALTCATVGVLPAAAFQIIKHEFSGTLELLSYSIIDFPVIEFYRKTTDYEAFVEYTTEGELLSWFLDLEGSSQLGSDTLDPLPLDLLPLDPLPLDPYYPITVTTFEATPDSWTLNRRDFGRFSDLGGETLSWNRESGIRFSYDFGLIGSIIYVDPNPNFKETITNDPSKAYPTSVPEPMSGLALLGITALGAGSLLKRKDK
ncbi:hypothetical protein [Moorena producens]|uniref:hypothetical protein n=1 Tax=Moorena producens TaxID=1155739 RepID=UPI003C739975